MWMLEDVDRAWSEDQVAAVLGQHFRDYQVVYRRAQRNGATWLFRATMPFNTWIQHLPVTVENEDGDTKVIDLWAKVAPPRKAVERLAQEITHRSVHHTSNFQPEIDVIRDERPAKGKGDKGKVKGKRKKGMDEGASDAGQSAGAGAAMRDVDEAEEVDDPDKSSERKRNRSRSPPPWSWEDDEPILTRGIPRGMDRLTVETDGHCVFNSLAAGLASVRGKAQPDHQRATRAEIGQHLARNEKRYSTMWDKKDHEGNVCSWEDYVQKITTTKA
jgi:hypothetical protein